MSLTIIGAIIALILGILALTNNTSVPNAITWAVVILSGAIVLDALI